MGKTRLYWARADFGDYSRMMLRANSRGKAKAFVSSECDIPFTEVDVRLIKEGEPICMDEAGTVHYFFKKGFEKDVPQQDGEDWTTLNFDNLVEPNKIRSK